MQEAKKFKIKIGKKKLAALYLIYSQLLDVFKPQNGHEALIYEHIVEMAAHLDNLILKRQETSSIKLTSAQALAFDQLWKIQPINDHYTGIAVSEVIEEIDHARKAPTAMELSYIN